jgi:tRNA G18 (ribose-2'-O)-methylase SpoU
VTPDNRQLEHADHQPARALRPLCIVADGVERPANVGSLFRIADAFGVEKLFLTAGSALPPHRELRKASRTTERAVAFESRQSALPVLAELRAAAYTIISLERSSRSRDLRTFDAMSCERLALVVGAERHGVSQAVLDASHHTLHIPMIGQNSSLNLATACAIAVFELTRGWLP